MRTILPHKGIEAGFEYNGADGLTIYEQNLDNSYLATDFANSGDYDLLFYMYQMDAQEAINAYNDNPIDGNIGDLGLMLF